MNESEHETRPNLVGGEWLAGSSVIEDRNPSDITDVVGIFAAADTAQVETAVAAARAAAPGWARTTGGQRFEILDRAGDEVLARRDELGDLLAREEGKTKGEAMGEVVRAGQILKFHAGEAVRDGGEHHGSVRPGIDVTITREPVGVVGIVTPWNFPIAIPAWKIAPALANGNTVVFEPAELVPASAWALVDILHRAGLPPGVLNLVMGRGSEIGDALVGARDVDAVSFTGSVATGAHVLQVAQAHRARVQLEMGGKNPLIVLDDADRRSRWDCATQGAFFSTGQRCTASSRLIVTAGNPRSIRRGPHRAPRIPGRRRCAGARDADRAGRRCPATGHRRAVHRAGTRRRCRGGRWRSSVADDRGVLPGASPGRRHEIHGHHQSGRGVRAGGVRHRSR